MTGERIDLRLVKMGDRLDIGRAIAVLHEETLVVFKTIGRTDNGVIQSVGMKVLDSLANAPLEIGRSHDLKVLPQAKASLDELTIRLLNHDPKMIHVPLLSATIT